MKAELKMALSTLVKKACRILPPYFAAMEHEKEAMLRKFMDHFTSHTYHASLTSIADYLVREKRQYRSNISLPHRLQSQQPILENLGKMWWHSITGFNMSDYPHIHEWILLGFPGHSDDAFAINCILYPKHFIYREKLNNQNMLTIDFLSYLSHLKYMLKIEKNICIAKNKIDKFDKFNNIYDNL